MNAVNRLVQSDTQQGLTIGSPVQTGWISACENGVYVIDEHIAAYSADGLGIGLMQGDYVSYLETTEGVFITSLLRAAKRASVSLEFNCADTLNLTADNLVLTGRETASLRAAKEISVETCKNIKLACENLFQTAFGSVVNVMKNWVHRCDQGTLNAAQMLQIDAENQVITANKDLRLDAERINMG